MESVDAALRYLQRQFASVASDEAQWNEERMELQKQVRELEDQRGEQEQAYKDAMLRVKMLEFALRQERGRYLASPAAVSSTGGAMNKPRSESAEISRGVTVSRSMERSKSARTAELPSPAPSPGSSPKAHHIYRTDSRNKSAASTPKGSQTGKGMEITRPRMISETYPDCPAGRAGAFATAGRDGSLRLFQLPGVDTDKNDPYNYEEYEGLKTHMIKAAHDDAIWDLHAHPLSNMLFSAGADGVVRTWGVASGMPLMIFCLSSKCSVCGWCECD
ncbi:hypothetical protein BBJ28_00004743 [Nothophytophthora sp. Chile5]|nr:hypothetical protein BBJ28_00004743 [Nothophytophthora sp. Chile5]